MCKAVVFPIAVVAFGMLAVVAAQAKIPTGHAMVTMAQAGFSFGFRDDLGPRYDPGSDRWDHYQPPYGPACRWVSLRTPLANGKVVLRRQRICGFKVPARQ